MQTSIFYSPAGWFSSRPRRRKSFASFGITAWMELRNEDGQFSLEVTKVPKSEAKSTKGQVSFKKTTTSMRVIFFSRMRSEGFPFIRGGLGVGPVFADRGSCVRWCSLPFAAVRLCSKYGLLPCRWAALTKCDKSICWMWISSQAALFCAVLWHGSR